MKIPNCILAVRRAFKGTAIRPGKHQVIRLILSLIALTFLSGHNIFSQIKKVPRSSDSIHFAVIGDYGSHAQGLGHDEGMVAKLVKSWRPDFIITVGDNNYPKGRKPTITQNIGRYYCDKIYNPEGQPKPCKGAAARHKKNLFFPTLGNHDWCTNGAKPYIEYFTQLPGNRRYYDFTMGPVHFFAIDSEAKEACSCDNPECFEPDGADEDSEQAQWLKHKLKESTSPWNLVYFHHAPYTCKKASKWMRWPFQDWGANAVFSGHKHLYERGWLADEKNFPYVVNGVGGTKLSECDANELKQASASTSFEEIVISGYYGAIRVQANPKSLTFKFYSADERQVLDECELEKTASGQKLTCTGVSKARKIPSHKKEIEDEN
ncbi:MAG: metallophosphoesterase [Acidobacteria bacterium]|nr:metallophosphoesterase [Acidobacteriota bacterium]